MKTLHTTHNRSEVVMSTLICLIVGGLIYQGVGALRTAPSQSQEKQQVESKK